MTDIDRVMALPTRGLHALKYAVQMLRESGWYRDEEGDATNALEELLEALASPAPSACTAPAKDQRPNGIESASAPAPQAQPVARLFLGDGNRTPAELFVPLPGILYLPKGAHDLYACPVSDRDLMERARLLCEWIAETPHQRGSINGAAAQLGAALRARLGEGAK